MRLRTLPPRLALLLALAAAAAHAVLATSAAQQPSAPPLLPGATLQFPHDFGSHPQFRIEWWYLTGWLTTAQGHPLGFQVTFFRVRPRVDDANPSAFTPHQLLIAHCALSDPTHGRLWQAQRIRRAGLGLAEAQVGDTRVWVDDWRLARREGGAGRGDVYVARVDAADFALDLTLAATSPPMLNGVAGFSRKGPASLSASEYYSQPQLRVRGTVTRAGHAQRVSGVAWLDHEWSSQYLDPRARGWDWVGLNMDDGSAVMAFEIRDRDGHPYWAGGTRRDAHGHTQVFGPDAIGFTPRRRWRSPRTGVTYPVAERVHIGTLELDVEPLLDDQEFDARRSSGALYWEGAVSVYAGGRLRGHGYLELTGYDRPLSLQ